LDIRAQIKTVLKQHEAGVPVADLSREQNISTALIYQWRSKYGGMDASMMRRLNELEARDSRLKTIYAEERIKAELCQEALEGKL
jgi:putative transposase